MFYIDPLYLILSLPALLIGLTAQFLVRYFYSKYLQTPNSADITGIDFVEMILRKYDLDIRLNISLGDLLDSYNPLRGVLTLSERVARTPSIASVGIAAHEMGHVLQHKKGFFIVGIRTLLVPIVNIGTSIGYILFLLGLSLNFFNVAILGIAFFSLSTLFTIITLPIEIDASIRALKMIRGLDIFASYEINGVKKVLAAAALTYVAGVMQSLFTLIYYVLRAFGVRKRK